MTSPTDSEHADSRFRRGGGRPAGPIEPPRPLFGIPDARGPVSTNEDGPISLTSYPAPAAVGAPPIPPLQPAGSTAAVGEAPPAPAGAYGVRPLFDDLVDRPAVQPLYDQPDYTWQPDEIDEGRTTGIVGVVVGIPVGVVGLIVGLVSVRASRRGGHRGTWGIAAIVVSLISMAAVAWIALGYAGYEIDLVRACAAVSPGQYLTEAGRTITCR